MPSHRLILERTPAAGDWLLEWDTATLRVKAPDGQPVMECPVAEVHRIIELYELDAEGKVSFATSSGAMTFRKNPNAARDVRTLVLEGLRHDHEFRAAQRRHARRIIPIALAATIVCGGLFALYCWWAIGSEDPPKGTFLYTMLVYFGWLIHLVLLVLLAAALAGPYLIVLSLRQLSRVRQAEQVFAERASG